MGHLCAGKSKRAGERKVEGREGGGWRDGGKVDGGWRGGWKVDGGQEVEDGKEEGRRRERKVEGKDGRKKRREVKGRKWREGGAEGGKYKSERGRENLWPGEWREREPLAVWGVKFVCKCAREDWMRSRAEK